MELRAGALARISGATPRRIANAILSGRRAVSWEHVGAAGAGQRDQISIVSSSVASNKMAMCCSHGACAGRTQVLALLDARAQPRPPGSSAADTPLEWLQTGPAALPMVASSIGVAGGRGRMANGKNRS